MADETSALLWDLRTQCEEMLRTLSQAQRCLEEYRESVPDALTRLGDEVQELRVEAADIALSVQQIGIHLRELPSLHPRRGSAGAPSAPAPEPSANGSLDPA